VPRLFADLEIAHGDGRFARLFSTLTKVDLLILDDWSPDRFTVSQRRDLMEIAEDRYGAGSTLITSQLPVEAWHEVIGEPPCPTARPPRGSTGTSRARRCA
jgi:DNA replication protein DnaC